MLLYSCEMLSSGMKASLVARILGEGGLVLWIRRNRRVRAKGRRRIVVLVGFFRGIMLLSGKKKSFEFDSCWSCEDLQRQLRLGIILRDICLDMVWLYDGDFDTQTTLRLTVTLEAENVGQTLRLCPGTLARSHMGWVSQNVVRSP